MMWIGGGQGAGKSTLSWQLSRAHDLPLHRIDRWTCDHQARMPAGHTLDEQLARGPEAAADAFESDSRLRLKLVLDDITARDLGTVPALLEGPQLLPGLSASSPGMVHLAAARPGAHAGDARGTPGERGNARRPPGGRPRPR